MEEAEGEGNCEGSQSVLPVGIEGLRVRLCYGRAEVSLTCYTGRAILEQEI